MNVAGQDGASAFNSFSVIAYESCWLLAAGFCEPGGEHGGHEGRRGRNGNSTSGRGTNGNSTSGRGKKRQQQHPAGGGRSPRENPAGGGRCPKTEAFLFLSCSFPVNF